MKKVIFPFEEEPSPIFDKIYRPVAPIQIWSFHKKIWGKILTVVDSGADYTLLPGYLARFVGIDLKRDCDIYPTSGIGGVEKVFLFRKLPVRIENWQSRVPVGFLNHDDVPPLLGRQGCLERIGVVFYRRKTTFILP